MDYHKFVYMEGNHHSDTDVAENKNKEKILILLLTESADWKSSL